LKPDDDNVARGIFLAPFSSSGITNPAPGGKIQGERPMDVRSLAHFARVLTRPIPLPDILRQHFHRWVILRARRQGLADPLIPACHESNSHF
jgi:hypothetical protein